MNGQAHGAVTIINATATGRGCSLAIAMATTASWTWADEYAWLGATDDRLAKAVMQVAAPLVSRAPTARIDCASPVPPSRGLKTSSAAAAAMLRAALGDGGEDPAGFDIAGLCVDAAIQAGVTLTGAFDDQVAVTDGGCHLTDNHNRKVLEAIDVPVQDVAVWVPHVGIPKSAVAPIDARVIRAEIGQAEAALLDGDIPQAMARNSDAYIRLYQAHGLPVTEQPVKTAQEAGAFAAGLSGTGPAVAALFDGPVLLPPVPGGQWIWTETA